jgi:hypothetical protein
MSEQMPQDQVGPTPEEYMESLNEVQQGLDKAVVDLLQEGGEIQFFDALGRLVEASDRTGTVISDDQREKVVRSLEVRGFRPISEELQDPEYQEMTINDPAKVEARGIAGNILQSVKKRDLIPPVAGMFAFSYRDKLIEQKKTDQQ